MGKQQELSLGHVALLFRPQPKEVYMSSMSIAALFVVSQTRNNHVHQHENG